MRGEDTGTAAPLAAVLLRWLGTVLCLLVLGAGVLHPSEAHAAAEPSGHGVPAVSADAQGEPCAPGVPHVDGATCCHGVAGCSLYVPLVAGLTPRPSARAPALAGTDTRSGADVLPLDRPPKLIVQA